MRVSRGDRACEACARAGKRKHLARMVVGCQGKEQPFHHIPGRAEIPTIIGGIGGVQSFILLTVSRPLKRGLRGVEACSLCLVICDGAFVGDLLTDAANLGNVRVDVVNEVQGAINDGSFEQSVDMDKVVDSLLADL